MKRLVIIAAAVCGSVASALASPPGTLDGQNILTDFANAKRIGVQTNHTGVGDVTSLQSVQTFSPGSELDALYLAKDTNYLYVGLAGNLLEVGNPFIIFIDNPYDFGQTELWTEGVDGPPFALQMAGRQVLVDDHGTPGNPADDTYTVVPNSGTQLPTCGNGWDFALAVDTAGGTMYAHQYILFDYQVGTASASTLCYYLDGRVSCDPTPGNSGDPALPLYATRNLVAQTPLGDGNEIFEGGQPQFGYQRGGFNNSNTAGVTTTSAAGAATALKGLEIAIPLANIGDAGLYGDETIRLMVLTMDADEYDEYPVSGAYGSFMNQALPSLTGASCGTPQSLGLRPDLRSVASCQTVNLSTLSYISTSAVLDGVIDPNDYHTHAPILTQQCPTSGGDAVQLADIQQPAQDGSELDGLFAVNDNQFLYLGLTGNLKAGGTSINVFVDVDGGAGDRVVSDFSNFTLSGTYEQWTTATFTSGATSFRVQSSDFGGGWYDIDPNLNAAGTTTLTLTFTINPANQADIIRVILTDGDLTERSYRFDVPGVGTHSLSVPLSAFTENSPGSVPGLDLSNLSFFHVTGGFNHGNPGVTFDVTFDRLALSDDDFGSHVLNFDPGPSAYSTTTVQDFSNFQLSGTYGSWSGATITSGPTDFRIQSTGGFGGGYYDINPNISLAGGLRIELTVTLNPACAPGGVLLVFSDEDGTEHRWAWYGLQPATTYTLTGNLSQGDQVVGGGQSGLDLSNISFFHIQGDFATTDITFDHLSILSVLPGVSPILTMNGNELPNGPLDMLGNGLFFSDAPVQYDFAYGINVDYTPHLAYVDYFDLVNDQFAFRGAVVPESGSAVLFDTGGLSAQNPNGLQMAFNNWNTTGVLGCNSGSPCFQDSASAVAALALQATTGMEMAIPLADLGLSSASLPRVIQLWTMVGERQGSASNQSLPSMRNATDDLNQVVNPGVAPVNFTDPESGPSAGALISDFSTFNLSYVYAGWTTGTFTSGPTSFRVQSTDWGGGLFDLDPDVEAPGATTMVLDFTFNPANVTDKLVVILVDADGTERVYRFENLTNGTHHLLRDLSTFNNDNAPGTVPGLDLAHLAVFHVAGAFHHGNPGVAMDVTFDNLELIGGFRNYEARAARVCLSTIAGDADCSGHNDMIDVALLQQAFGMTRNPVFPMEVEQLDLVKDGLIDFQDFQSLSGLIGGP